jgi:hypothetical protein
VGELNDTQKFTDEEIVGVRMAVDAMHTFLSEVDVRIDGDLDQAWLAHIVLLEGMCDCDLKTDYDGAYDVHYCSWYRDHENRLTWWCYWHNTTPERLEEWLAAEKAYNAEQERLQAEQRRQQRLARLHELAAEFGVDARLLP